MRSKTDVLGQGVEQAEAEVGAEKLMLASESRQIETINGRRDGLYAPPAWELSNPPSSLSSSCAGGVPASARGGGLTLDQRVAHIAPEPAAAPGRAKRRPQGSVLTRIEDDWLSKLAL